jgi:zinc transport system substrate-binding protein
VRKVIFVLWIFALFCLPLAADAAEPKKLLVVASLFPQYDFVRQIAGDKAKVVLLLTPGTESHTFDPTPGDLKTLQKADLFVYTGKVMEPWAGRIVESLDNASLLVIDASEGIKLKMGEIHDREENLHDDAARDHGYDPHVWLDFSLAMTMADNVTRGLCAKDPANADFYKKNAAAYREKLRELDREFLEAVGEAAAASGRETLVFGGRFAYRYFLDRYGLKYVTAYDSCSTEGEPSLRRIADVIRYITNNGVRAIFHEELVDPRVARSIAEQTGAEPLLFSTAHNVGRDEFEAGITFIDVMRRNLENVKKGLMSAK